MIRRLTLGIVLILVVIGLTLFYQSAAISTRSGEDSPLYSIHRYDPYGTAAFKELLTERNIPVRALHRPSLEPTDHGVLIQVLPHYATHFTPATHRTQTQRLIDWISQGNTIIQFTREPTDLVKHCKITLSKQPDAAFLSKLHDFETRGKPPAEAPATPHLANWNSTADPQSSSSPPDTKRLLLTSPAIFAERQDPAWRPLARLRDQSTSIVAAEYRIGKGKLVLIGAPTPTLNGTISQEGNLDFLLSVVGNGPVIMDEWSHGIGHEATVIGFIRSAGLLPVVLQLAFLVLLYIWSTSGHARYDDNPRIRQRSSIEQIETLGYLYSQSLSRDLTFERVYAEVQRRLADALRCQPHQIRDHLKTLKPELRAKYDHLADRINRIGRAQGPRCRACGYDLTMNTSGRCPECGGTIPIDMQQRITESASMSNLPERSSRRRVRIDSDLGSILTLSHQLVQEAERDRRARQ